MLRLMIVSNDETTFRFFKEDSFTIGSSEENLLQLSDEGVSETHARVEKTDKGYCIVDLETRLGTFVDRNRVERALLAEGDLIELGDAVLYIDKVERPTRHIWVRRKQRALDSERATVIDPEVAEPLAPEESARPQPEERGEETLDTALRLAREISDRCRAEVRGRDDVIELVVISLIAGGHVLLEDYPGSGKTTLAKALGNSLIKTSPNDAIKTFRRIQFTPDLLPSDVTGVTFFDAKNHNFVFRPGPVFANIVLADEINRASPKVQAALLEAMAEKQVTVDNETHALEDLFCVIATQNPLDTGGTYPLPSPQLDRFLFKIKMHHLTPEAEMEVLSQSVHGVDTTALPRVRVQELEDVRSVICAEITVDKAIHKLLIEIAGALRSDKRVSQGISTRALVLAIPALQVRAMLRDRDFVTPEDVLALLVPLFSHRLVLRHGVRDVDTIVLECAEAPLENAVRNTLKR